MRETRISLPELGLIAATRAGLGFGLGLLLANSFSDSQRRAIGWTLTAIGVASTIPLALDVWGRSETAPHAVWPEPALSGNGR